VIGDSPFGGEEHALDPEDLLFCVARVLLDPEELRRSRHEAHEELC
jgi:hypothetical protein